MKRRAFSFATVACSLLCAAFLSLTSSCACKITPPEAGRLFPKIPDPAGNGPQITPSELANVNVEQWKDFPIVDIHTHTFNALYLPILNIAQGRVREHPFGWTLSETVVIVLAHAIIGSTLQNQESGISFRPQNLKARRVKEKANIATLFGITPDTVKRGAQAAREKGISSAMLPNDTVLFNIIINDDYWRRFGREIFGVKDLLQLTSFLAVLTSNDASNRLSMQDAFQDRIALSVHHTMDMGLTYAEEPDDESFWNFHTKQLPRVRDLDLRPGNDGRFLHFVSFSPYRSERQEPAGGWRQSTAITLIDDAIKKGAWGVKYYPPAGYRPAGNDIPDRPSFGALPQRQWDSRYEGFSNEELDALNLAFFEYCAERNIPVLAHCHTGEFQAASCYGQRMAHPAYYREVLEKLTNRPTPLHLRLCLAHAGGPDFWFTGSTAEHYEWGRQVWELCTRFPNVYCEVGILSGILNEKEQATFTTRMAALLNRPVEPGRYPFSEKFMYGTDWFMPDAAEAGVEFLDAYRRVFLHEALRDHYKNFFCRNALRFLDVTGDPAGHTGAVPVDVRRRLEQLVERSKQ